MNKKVISKILVTALCSVTVLNPLASLQRVASMTVQAKTISGTEDFEISNGTLNKGKANATKVVIPDGVTKIGDYAYEKNDTITELEMPDSVEYIGSCAFSGCKNLKKIKWSSSLKQIGESAFGDCVSLESGELPEGITYIEPGVFCGCTSLKKVVLPTTLEKMGWSVFRQCSNLEEVIIPDSLTVFGGTTFLDTKWLEEKRKENPLVIINGSLLDAMECKGKVVVPEGVKRIEKAAFSRCDDLEAVQLPDSLKTIEDSVFANCPKLTTIYLPKSVTSMGDYVFYECSNLKSVAIPKEVTGIGKATFTYKERERGLTIYGEKGSEAEQVANHLKITFKDISEYVEEEIPEPSKAPTKAPTMAPTKTPTQSPGTAPTKTPDQSPGTTPTKTPEQSPTMAPTQSPTQSPSIAPTKSPTQSPSTAPTKAPTQSPTQAPTATAPASTQPSVTAEPTQTPDTIPTEEPKTENKKIKKTYGDGKFSVELESETPLNYRSSNTKVATITSNGTVTIKGCGKSMITIIDLPNGHVYQRIELTVSPKKPSLSIVKTSTKKVLKVKWKKDTKADGYEIYYGKNKNFTGKKSVFIKNNKTTSKTIKKLKSGTKYYVKIRAYKKANGVRIKGSWSKVVCIKAK